MRFFSIYPRLCACHAHVIGVDQRVGEVVAFLRSGVACYGRFRYAVGVGVAFLVVLLQATEGVLIVRPVRLNCHFFSLRAGLHTGAAQRKRKFLRIVVCLASIHPRLYAAYDYVIGVDDGVGEVISFLRSRVTCNRRFHYAVGIGIAFLVVPLQIGEGILVAVPLRRARYHFGLRACLRTGAA